MISKTKKLLAERIQKNKRRLWEWHQGHARSAPPPLYCSIDLRDSGHKVVPVDSNLYPAGFNNICPEDLRNAPPLFRAEIENTLRGTGHAAAKRILILPESHTQNLFYIENLYYLRQIISEAGYEVQIGWYGRPPKEGAPSEPSREPVHLKSATGKELTAFPLRIEGGILTAGGFTPDLILLNNDFSSGYPEPLDAVTQPIVPSHALGWHSRKKSEHFLHYNRLAAEFAAIIDVDPWLIQIDTEEVAPVNFNENTGLEETAATADRMLERMRRRYEAHNVKHKPFVFVKNNAGTYGMGVMVVHSADELRHLNRREKNKMSVGKNHLAIDSVVVQEGIPTATLVNRLAAEPVIYLFGCELIGGFLRTNPEKGVEDNLNSQGMVFRKLCMSDLRESDTDLAETAAEGEAAATNKNDDKGDDEPILELVYGSIARISALATGMELMRHQRGSTRGKEA